MATSPKMSRITAVVIGCLAMALVVIIGSTAPHQAEQPTPAHPGSVLSHQATLPVPATKKASTPTPIDLSALSNPSLIAFVDKQSRDRLPADLAARLPSVSTGADQDAVLHVLHDTTERDGIRNEAINLLRRSAYADLSTHLIAILDDPTDQPRFRGFAAQHLGITLSDDAIGEEEHHRIRERLHYALSDQESAVRREALQGLASIRDPQAIQVVNHGLTDPTWRENRDLIIHCAHDLGLSDLIPSIRPLAYDQDQVVRIAALNVLGQWRDSTSRSAFDEAKRSDVPRLQRAGDLALHLLEPALTPSAPASGSPTEPPIRPESGPGQTIPAAVVPAPSNQ